MSEVLQHRDLSLCETCLPLGGCRIGVADLRMAEDENVAGTFVVPDDVRGHVVAHGGWIAWVFDETLGLLPHGRGEWGITSTLSIRYLRPVPIGAEVAVSARLVSTQGRTWHVEGEMRLASSDTLLASASGDWIILADKEAHYERAREWCFEITGRR